jgi:hypothetical protein
MEITEATAIVRARAYIKRCQISRIPVDVQQCAALSNAEIRSDPHLSPGESGSTIEIKGRHIITVNSNDRPERIRFTVFHELAHIELELPSKHGDGDTNKTLYNYVKRPREEVLCDIFAAECIVPFAFLSADLKSASPGIAFLTEIATRYEASLSCAASRVTESAPFPCAYVLSQDGFVRFVNSSASMRSTGFWVAPGISVPSASVTSGCVKSTRDRCTGVTPGYVWTGRDTFMDIELNEEVIVLRAWNQAITLIWPDDIDAIDLGDPKRHQEADSDPQLLKELDGNLPWPGRRKRR